MSFLPIDFRDTVAQSTDARLVPIFAIGLKRNAENTSSSYVLQPGPQREYPYPLTDVALEAVSTDPADAAPAVVLGVSGLNSSYEVVQEAVLLDGTTPVPLANTYFRINRAALVVAATPANTNAGVIKVRVASTGDVLAQLPPGQGASRNGVFTAPFDYNLRVINFYTGLFSRTSNGSGGYGAFGPQALLSIRINSGFPTNHWRKNIFLPTSLGYRSPELSLPIFLQAKSTVELRVEEVSAAPGKKFALVSYLDAVLEKV